MKKQKKFINSTVKITPPINEINITDIAIDNTQDEIEI
jgi:hypothetical protein